MTDLDNNFSAQVLKLQAAEELEQRAAADAEAAEEDDPPLQVRGRAKLAVSRRQLARRADAPPQAQIPFSALPKVRKLFCLFTVASTVVMATWRHELLGRSWEQNVHVACGGGDAQMLHPSVGPLHCRCKADSPVTICHMFLWA